MSSDLGEFPSPAKGEPSPVDEVGAVAPKANAPALRPALIPRPANAPRPVPLVPKTPPKSAARAKVESIAELDADDLLADDADDAQDAERARPAADETEELSSTALVEVEAVADAIAFEAAAAAIGIELGAPTPAPAPAPEPAPALAPVPSAATEAAPLATNDAVTVRPPPPSAADTTPSVESEDQAALSEKAPQTVDLPVPAWAETIPEAEAIVSDGGAGASVDALADTGLADGAAPAPVQASALAPVASAASASQPPVASAASVASVAPEIAAGEPWRPKVSPFAVKAIVAVAAVSLLVCVVAWQFGTRAGTSAERSRGSVAAEPVANGDGPALEPTQGQNAAPPSEATAVVTASAEPVAAALPSVVTTPTSVEPEPTPADPSPLADTPAPASAAPHHGSLASSTRTQPHPRKRAAKVEAPPPPPPPAPVVARPSTGVVHFAESLAAIELDGRYVRVKGGALTVACGLHKVKAGMGSARVVNVPCGGSVSL